MRNLPFSIAPSTSLAVAGMGVGLVAAARLLRGHAGKISIYSGPESPLKRVLNECPYFEDGGDYSRPGMLWNGHVETIFAALFRRDTFVRYKRECLIMEDKGCVALDWPLEVEGTKTKPPPEAPLVILLPGLTGGSHDTYVKHMVSKCWAAGLNVVVFNSRGTSDSPVTTPQFYSASFTGDMRGVVRYVKEKFPENDLMACGWSLGANILVRYLGEEGPATPIRAAASLCNPFNLSISDKNFEKGFNRIYDWNLAKSLRNIFAKHQPLFEGLPPPYKPELAATCKTIREFDDALTRVSFGWPDVDAYYAGSSSSLSIPSVTIPLLCVSAADDPIAPIEAVPFDAIKANPNTLLIVTPHGGHLGWIAGEATEVLAGPWPDVGVVQFFGAALRWQKDLDREKAAVADAPEGEEEVGAGAGVETTAKSA